MDLLLAHASSHPVRTQLCLAVAALVAHMPPERWAPSGSVAWLVQHISKDGKEGALSCLLDLLAILPEVSFRPDNVVMDNSKMWLLTSKLHGQSGCLQVALRPC